MKLMDILNERVDFHQIATELVRKAGLKSKVVFRNTGDNKADYNVDDDTINIKPTSNYKDFLVTVFPSHDPLLALFISISYLFLYPFFPYFLASRAWSIS